MLVRLIKEESLRTYLFTYSNVYSSISMQTLPDMFELNKPVVHSIISKMIINEELMVRISHLNFILHHFYFANYVCICLHASLDDPTQTVVMHRSEPSRLQSLALQLSDKINNFVDSNERIFEMKQGNFFQRGAGSAGTGGNQSAGAGSQNTYRQGYNRQNTSGGGQDWNRQRNRVYNNWVIFTIVAVLLCKKLSNGMQDRFCCIFWIYMFL